MKTPDEIKKGLELCGVLDGDCENCAYDDGRQSLCGDHLRKDALAYIQQLESRLAQVEKDLAFKEKCLEWRYNDIARAEDMIDDLNAKLAQVEKERDAAIHDLHRYCSTCKHDPRKEFNKMPCKLCMDNKIDGYEWRGVCPENSKEE